MARQRAQIPQNVAVKLAALHAARLILERRHLRELARGVRALEQQVRDAIRTVSTGPWTLTAHARAMQRLRPIARVFGASLSDAAYRAASDAADQGVERYVKTAAILASAAVERKVSPDAVRSALTLDERTIDEHVTARTESSGARSGEDIGQAGVAASYVESQKSTLPDGAVVAGVVAGIMAKRAWSDGERLIVTEITAGGSIGGEAVGLAMADRHPRMLKYWDATLDGRVCSQCLGLHHETVPQNESFTGGLDDAPAHARCRCVVGPWTDDWQSWCDDLGIGPAERRNELLLSSFDTRIVELGTLH